MFGYDPVVVACVVLAGTTAYLGTKALLEKITARNDRRQAARVAGTALAKLGFEQFPLLLFAYSDGDYPEFVQRVKDMIELLKGDPKKVLAEIAGVVKLMAKTPDGLKMIQDALAEATPAPVA